MTIIPSLSYFKIISALKRDGWVVVRQRGSHIRLQKHTRAEVLKLTIPVAYAHQAVHFGAHPETSEAFC